jgi:hypothetical protein
MDLAGKQALIDELDEEFSMLGVWAPPEAVTWSEAGIRQFFESGGCDVPSAEPPAAPPPAPSPAPTPAPPAAKQTLPKLFPVSDAVFKTWFPAVHQTACARPKLRLVCFPNAGSAENIYTKINRGKPNTLIGWAKENMVEVLAVQPPGREMRRKEPCLGSCKEIAQALFPVLAPRLLQTKQAAGGEDEAVPFAIMAHSVGTWVQYELMRLFQERHMPMPVKIFLSCFPPPTIPEDSRPWIVNKTLTTDQSFQEECKLWDVNQVVFSGGMWEMYKVSRLQVQHLTQICTFTSC